MRGWLCPSLLLKEPLVRDMRGSAAADLSGALQTQALLLLNGLVAGWLAASLLLA